MNLRIILIIIALVNFFLPIAFVPLFDLDEGAFSEATREMLNSGNYITTYLNGNLRFDKPILIYWLQLFSIKTFGINEFAFRFPSALAASFWALSVWLFSKKYFNEKVAFFATVVMLGSLQINIIAKAAIADALLNLFIANSLFFIWLYLDSKAKKYLYLAFASIALGFLTKGPVAILIPLATTFIYMLIKKDLREFFKMVFNPIGIVIFLIIAMPWYILEYLEQGQKFIEGFFLKHNLKRFSSPLEHHSGTLFYFIPVVILGFLPFTTPLINTLLRVKSYFKNSLFLYLFIWFTFVFIFFSLSGTKLPHYVIYGYTPLFILIGYYLAQKEKIVNWGFLIPNILLFAILFSFRYIIDFFKAKNSYYQELFSAAKTIFASEFQAITLAVIAAFIAIKYIKIKNEYKLSLIALIFGLYINMVVVKSYASLAQEPIKEAALYAKRHNLNVILYHFTKPSFLVYRAKLSLKKRPKPGDYVITKKSNLSNFKKYRVKFSKNGIYLIKVEE